MEAHSEEGHHASSRRRKGLARRRFLQELHTAVEDDERAVEPAAHSSAHSPADGTTTSSRGKHVSSGHGGTHTDGQQQARLAEFLRTQDVGRHDTFTGPYGSRLITYCDHTASGRVLACIEDYMRQEVMPVYGNTHTSVSYCGHQTSMFRAEARQLIKQAVHGGKQDVVLFCGSGTTGAVATLIHILGLGQQEHQRAFHCTYPACGRWFVDAAALKLHQRTHEDGGFASNSTSLTATGEAGPESAHSVTVFVGPFEHHSNLLSWREAGADVIQIPQDAVTGGVSLVALEDALKSKRASALPADVIIGSFSAGSNVTGQLNDTDVVTSLLHRYGALSFWDYAAAAPHMAIDMNPAGDGTSESQAALAKDAVFFSPHKFLGGPGTPGVLVLKKRLFQDATPFTPGGGTVFFVSPDATPRYLENEEEREEGGTPNILGSIRAGLVLNLHTSLGHDYIWACEQEYASAARIAWRAHPNLLVLGQGQGPRLPIVSMLVAHGTKFLHWAFVAQILNDLFGIQCRGGCMCAGPFGSHLLGLDSGAASRIEEALLEKHELLRPGFVRIGFSFSMTPMQVQFIIRAMLWVAENGHKLLTRYAPVDDTGEWRHKAWRRPPRRWLHGLSYTSGHAHYVPCRTQLSSHVTPELFDTYFVAADAAAAEALRLPEPVPEGILSDAVEPLRWFALGGTEAGPAGSFARQQVASLPQLVPVRLASRVVVYATAGDVPSLLEAGATLANGDNSSIHGPRGHLDDLVDDDAEGQVEGKLFEPDASVVQPSDEHEVTAIHGIGARRVAPQSSENTDAEISACRSTGGVQFSLAVRSTVVTKLALKPPRGLLGAMARCCREFNLIRDGDHLMLGLSGGKDSLSLLHMLLYLKHRNIIKFQLSAVTVDPQAPGFNPAPLQGYLKSLGVPYFVESQPIIERAAKHMVTDSICSWCSRMRRGILYAACRREGANVLVLAQHLDDLAETFLMSAFHNGVLRTLRTQFMNDTGDVRVIRPLAYVRERQLRAFADKAQLPVIEENCPACFQAPTERARMKKLLASQEHVYPSIMNNLCRAMKPLMSETGDPEREEG